MKKIIERFKQIIRFIVTIFASREFAFLYCVLGVFAQIAHTYFLLESISSFQGGFKIFQAVLLSAFISSSLLYFVAIIDNSDSKENKRNKLAVNIFMLIEILINLYYYVRHLIIDSPQIQIFDFIFAVLVSCLIPVTIKLYGSHIRAHEWQNEMITQNNIVDNYDKIDEIITEKVADFLSTVKYNGEEINFDELISEKVESIKKEMLNNFDSDVSKIFEKNQILFLTQFENKCQLLLKKQIQSIDKINISE